MVMVYGATEGTDRVVAVRAVNGTDRYDQGACVRVPEKNWRGWCVSTCVTSRKHSLSRQTRRICTGPSQIPIINPWKYSVVVVPPPPPLPPCCSCSTLSQSACGI